MTYIVAHDLKKTEFKTIAAFCAYTEIGKHKEARVFVVVFSIFEVVQGRDHGASGTARLAILEKTYS